MLLWETSQAIISYRRAQRRDPAAASQQQIKAETRKMLSAAGESGFLSISEFKSEIFEFVWLFSLVTGL